MAAVMSQCGGLQIMLKRYLFCTTVDTRQSLVAADEDCRLFNKNNVTSGASSLIVFYLLNFT